VCPGRTDLLALVAVLHGIDQVISGPRPGGSDGCWWGNGGGSSSGGSGSGGSGSGGSGSGGSGSGGIISSSSGGGSGRSSHRFCSGHRYGFSSSHCCDCGAALLSVAELELEALNELLREPTARRRQWCDQ
jgi:hypothetical protein